MPRTELTRPRQMPLNILGAVIAGGRSSRFGSDKAAALLQGRTLLDHAIAGMTDQTGALVVCGREVAGQICLADRPRPGLGPLGGLAAALHYAAGNGFDGVLTSACDTPIVPDSLAERLAGSGPAIVAGQPLFGYWPASLARELDRFLTDPAHRSMRDWAIWAEARRVRFPVEIPNINTTADLAALRLGKLADA